MVDPDLRRQVLEHMSWDEQASHANSTTVSHRPYRPKPRKKVTFTVPEAFVIPSPIERGTPDDIAQEAVDLDTPIASIERSLSPLVGTSTERNELEEEDGVEGDEEMRRDFIRERHPSLSPTILLQRSQKRRRSTPENESEELQFPSELREERRENPVLSSKKRSKFPNTASPPISQSGSRRSYQATPELEQTPSPTFCPGFQYSGKNGESSSSSSSRVKRQRKDHQRETEYEAEQESMQALHERRVSRTPPSTKGKEPCRLNPEYDVEQSPSLVFSPRSPGFGNRYKQPVGLSPSPESEGKSSVPEYEVRSPPRLSSPVPRTFGKRYQRSLDGSTSTQSKGKGCRLDTDSEQERSPPPAASTYGGQQEAIHRSSTPRSKGKRRRLDSECQEWQNSPPAASGYDQRHAIDRSPSSQAKEQNLELNSASVEERSSQPAPFVSPEHFIKRYRVLRDQSPHAQPEGMKRRKLDSKSEQEQPSAEGISQYFSERHRDSADHSPHATPAQQVRIPLQKQSPPKPKPSKPRGQLKRHRSPPLLRPNYHRPLSTKLGINKKWTINKAPFFSPTNFEADAVAMGMGGRGTRAKDRKEKMSRVREYWAVPESSGIKVYGRVAVTESRAWVEEG